MDFLPPKPPQKSDKKSYYARLGRARYLLRTEASRRAREEKREQRRLEKEVATQRWHDRQAAAKAERIEAVRAAAAGVDVASIKSADRRIRAGLELIAKAEALQVERAARLAASKERQKEKAREYRIANRDRNLELQRRWREANKEKRYAHNTARRRAQRTKLKLELIKAQNGKCAYCRVKLRAEDMHVDHIHPLSKGGSNERSNLQLTCSGCNLRKNAKDPLAFAKELGRLV